MLLARVMWMIGSSGQSSVGGTASKVRPPLKEFVLLTPLLYKLLLETVLELKAQWHLASVIFTRFRMEAANVEKLTTELASTLCAFGAKSGVCKDTLHLVAGAHATVGTMTLTGVHQCSDKRLEAGSAASRTARAFTARFTVGVGIFLMVIKTKLFHWMWVVLAFVALSTEVILSTLVAVPTGFNLRLADVASVQEALSTFVGKLREHLFVNTCSICCQLMRLVCVVWITGGSG